MGPVWSHVSNARGASPVPLEDFPDEGAALSAVDRGTDVDGGGPGRTHDDLESVQAGAKSAYAFYHFAELGSISDAEVGRSSAGAQGWFKHHMNMSQGDEVDPEYLSFCGVAATTYPARQDTAAEEPEDRSAEAVHSRHERAEAGHMGTPRFRLEKTGIEETQGLKNQIIRNKDSNLDQNLKRRILVKTKIKKQRSY